MKLSEYLKLSREERTKHVNLSTPCEVDESVSPQTRRSRGRVALLEKLGLEDDVENWSKGKVNLCHSCQTHSLNGWCTNLEHLCLGTPSENRLDVPEEVRKESSLVGASAGGRASVELGVGLHDPKNQEVVREGQREGGRKGGRKAVELGVGLHDPKNREAVLEGNRKGGKNGTKEGRVKGGRKGGRRTVELGVGLHDPKKPELRREGGRKGGLANGGKGARTTNSQRRLCLVTGHVSNPGALAQYQKKRGVPTYLYAELDGSDLVSQTALLGLVNLPDV